MNANQLPLRPDGLARAIFTPAKIQLSMPHYTGVSENKNVNRFWARCLLRASLVVCDNDAMEIIPGDAVIVCGLMGSRKTTFAVEHFLLAADIKTISNIPLNADCPANTVSANLYEDAVSSGLTDRVVVWDEIGAWWATASKIQQNRLASWLATIRHKQIAVVFVCQAPEQLANTIHTLISKTVRFVNLGQRIGFFNKSSTYKIYLGAPYSWQMNSAKMSRLLIVVKSGRYTPAQKIYDCFQSVDIGSAFRKYPPSAKIKRWFFLLAAGLPVAAFMLVSKSGAFWDEVNKRELPVVVSGTAAAVSKNGRDNYACTHSGAKFDCVVW